MTLVVTPQIRRATTDDGASITKLVHALLIELTPANRQILDLDQMQSTTVRLLDHLGSRLWVYLASDRHRGDIGVLTVTENFAVYAGGPFGVITELYVDPEFRSAGTGEALINAGIKHAGERGWSRVEVGAPGVPRWQRTVSFYKANGFAEVGPRLCRMT